MRRSTNLARENGSFYLRNRHIDRAEIVFSSNRTPRAVFTILRPFDRFAADDCDVELPLTVTVRQNIDRFHL